MKSISTPPLASPSLRWLLVASGAGFLLAHFQSLGTGVRDVPVIPGAAVAGWVSALCSVNGSGVLARVFDSLVVVATAVFAGRVAARLALKPRVCVAVAALAAMSPAAGCVLWDVSGRPLALATLAITAALAVPLPTSPASGQPRWFFVGGRVLLTLLAVFFSQGAFLPLAVLLFLVDPPQRKTPPMIRLQVGALIVAVLAPVLFFSEVLPDLGFGQALHEGASEFAPTAGSPAPPGPPFLAAALAMFGWRADLPLLVPGSFAVRYSALSTGGLVLVLMLLVVPAPVERRRAVRFGSAAVLLTAFAAVWVSALSPTSAISGALLFPGSVGVAVLIGSFAQPRRRTSATPVGPMVVAVFGCLLLLQSVRLASATTPEVFQQAHELAPASPYPALRLAEIRRREGGEHDLGPLRTALLASGSPVWPAPLETRIGLRVARELEQRRQPDQVLGWLDEWSALRRKQGRSATIPLAQVRRTRALLELGRTEEALALLEEQKDSVALAEALIDFLNGRVVEEELSGKLQAECERLLAPVAKSTEPEGAQAMVSFAMLRSGQGRFIDATRLAEQAARKDPSSASPEVALARIYLGLGELEAGFRHVKQAKLIDADAPDVLFVEGRLLSSAPGRESEGIEKMIGALERDPDLAGGGREISASAAAAAASLRAAGRVKQALELLNNVAGVASPGADMWLETGRAHLLLRDKVNAEKAYRKAVKAAPENADALRELAEILRNRGYGDLLAGETAKAVEVFKEVIALEAPGVSLLAMQEVVRSHEPGTRPAPDVSSVQLAKAAFDRGVEQYSNGDLEQAAGSFEESLRHASANPLAHLHLGRIRFELLQREGLGEEQQAILRTQAEEHLRVAQALGPQLQIDVEYAYLLLVRLALDSERLDTAREVAGEYAARHPDGAYAEQLSRLLEKSEDQR